MSGSHRPAVFCVPLPPGSWDLLSSPAGRSAWPSVPGGNHYGYMASPRGLWIPVQAGDQEWSVQGAP